MERVVPVYVQARNMTACSCREITAVETVVKQQDNDMSSTFLYSK